MSRASLASGEPPDVDRTPADGPSRLVGRDADLRRLAEAVADARAGRARAILVTGEAGMGKTSLLDRAVGAAQEAGDVRVVRTRGVGSEASIGHGALLQLLAPLRADARAVPGAQRRALEAALGWSDSDDAADRFLVGAATLSLLAAAAERAPLLVVVDDLQWVDRESVAAVLFVARRLAHDRVAVVLAGRDEPDVATIDGVERLTLSPLGADDAALVLGAATAPSVVRRLVQLTGGNPLALVEAAATLSPAQRRGAAPLPIAPLDTGTVESLFDGVLRDAGADLRLAAAVVAASGDQRGALVRSAITGLGLDADELLEELERRRIVVLEPGVVRCRHPLQRAAIWRAAGPEERRAAHLALATALGGTSAAVWHRADAATSPDDELADELVALAARDRRRHGHAAASLALERAARLTGDPQRAATLLADATADAVTAGDVARARALAAEVLGLDAGATDEPSGRALAALGAVEAATGSVVQAERLLTRAAAAVTGRDRTSVLVELVLVRHRLGDLAGMGTATAELERDAASSDDPVARWAALHLGGLVASSEGRTAEGRRLLLAALALLDAEPELRDDPRWLAPSTLAAGWLELTPKLVEQLEAMLDAARRAGALAALVPTLSMFAHGRAMLGDHAGAYADAAEAVELASELGFVSDAAPALEMLARQHAHRGDHRRAAEELERAASLVARAGTTGVAAHLALARAELALCRDDVDGIITALEPRLTTDGLRGSLGEELGAAPLLVEAYAMAGRGADAAALADRMARVEEPDPRTAALVHRSAALASDDDAAAVAAFERAIEQHLAASDAPYEIARTELLLGSRLRRAGRRSEARDVLRRARDRFDAMDLTSWSARCTAELAATGETRRHGREGFGEALTPQEARVAQLVVRGLTNVEIAASMFLSPKTVEHHLSSVYRKRGVRSRTELTRLLLG